MDDLPLCGQQPVGNRPVPLVLRQPRQSPDRVHLVLFNRRRAVSQDLLGQFLDSRVFWYITVFLFLLGGLLVFPSFKELVLTGATYEHWSRFIVMSFLYSIAIILIGTKIIDYSLNLLADRLDYLNRRNSG